MPIQDIASIIPIMAEQQDLVGRTFFRIRPMIRLTDLQGCKFWLVYCAAMIWIPSISLTKTVAQTVRVTTSSAPDAGLHDVAKNASPPIIRDIRFEKLPSEKPGRPLAVAVKDDLPRPWWSPEAKKQLSSNVKKTRRYSLDKLIMLALEHSAQIQVDSDLPLIRETAIVEADSEFDWTLFLETKWRDASDPVGSTLTVGGTGRRFRDHQWTSNSGFRRKNRLGGNIEIGQQLGHQDNNSSFFSPKNQGTARLTMSYTQPLLRNAGRVYNESLTVMARIDSDIATEEFTRKLQDQLFEVARAYWGLQLERAALLQKTRLFNATDEIVRKIESRQEIDSYQSQLIRARAALAARQSDLIRATQAVRNAESRIRALVNAPEFDNYDTIEIIPVDDPTVSLVDYKEAESVESALQNRPEVIQALEQIRAASVRLQMSENEILPALNLVMESYVAGLQGRSNIPQAWVDQFSVGEPGYSAGIQYEIPINNRYARARLQRRQYELRQIQNQMRVATEKVKLEVLVAVREVDTSYREMKARFQAMQAAVRNRDYIRQRWELLPGEDRSASLVFDDLLRAQKAVADAEYEFAKSQITYNLALVNVKRSTGELLAIEPGDLPTTAATDPAGRLEPR